MARYFLECAYDGSAYHGWQVQPNGISVQQVLEDKLQQLLQHPVPLTGSGRTDTGVHARQQVAHFDAPGLRDRYTPDEFVYKLNRMLPEDIAVFSLRPVQPDAHARFNARRRTYEYFIHFHKDPFLRQYSCPVSGTLDLTIMQQAASVLTEYSDFSSFCKAHAGSKTNLCKVDTAKWEALDEQRWRFTIAADRFLRNMVRAVVGTLLEAGRGRLTVDEFRMIIETLDRRAAGNSAPAQGLFLVKVEYPDHLFTESSGS